MHVASILTFTLTECVGWYATPYFESDMKVKQIVIKDDDRSESYAEISRKSFQRLIDDETIDFETFDAITPDHPEFAQICARYNWLPSLAKVDLMEGTQPDDHSPTEKAGMCSHWELMRQQGESEERFLVMEHDTYLWEGVDHANEFRNLLEYIVDKNLDYANIGLFMGCYQLSPHCAKWMYQLLSEQAFWINGGPYGIMERLFKNYIKHYLSKRDYFGKENICIHPYANCDTLYFGRDIFSAYNYADPNPDMSIKNPTTQVVSKKLAVTQDHHGYPEKYIKEPWTRSRNFKVLT